MRRFAPPRRETPRRLSRMAVYRDETRPDARLAPDDAPRPRVRFVEAPAALAVVARPSRRRARARGDRERARSRGCAREAHVELRRAASGMARALGRDVAGARGRRAQAAPGLRAPRALRARRPAPGHAARR